MFENEMSDDALEIISEYERIIDSVNGVQNEKVKSDIAQYMMKCKEFARIIYSYLKWQNLAGRKKQ